MASFLSIVGAFSAMAGSEKGGGDGIQGDTWGNAQEHGEGVVHRPNPSPLLITLD